MDNLIRVLRVIRLEVNGKVMWAVHSLVHREIRRFDISALSGLDRHRGDRQIRLAAAFQNLNIWGFLESQRAGPVVSI